MKTARKTRRIRQKVRIIFGIILNSVLVFTMGAQSASYNTNSVPIFGNDNAAFGFGAMNNGACAGVGNAATGYYALNSICAGDENTANGKEALFSNVNANRNTGIGCYALYNTNSGGGGDDNTGVGDSVLFLNHDGVENVAVGAASLRNNVNGWYNTAAGFHALYYNNFNVASDGHHNTGIGHNALFKNKVGNMNTALGKDALFSNNNSRNTAAGYQALYTNTGERNTAVGMWASLLNSSGTRNTSFGIETLFGNTTGDHNTAIGPYVLIANNSGSKNTGMGHEALNGNTSGSYNSACGGNALDFINHTGDTNTALGYMSDVGSANLIKATALGAGAIVNASRKVRIGSTNVTVVEQQVLFTVSDGRFKTSIREDEIKGMAFIKLLRPVVYNFDTRKFTEFLTKNMKDSVREKYLAEDYTSSTAIRQSGFIAQEVEKVAKQAGYNFNGVHVPDDANDNYSIAYGQFVVPLVKGMQEQQALIESLEAKLSRRSEVANELIMMTNRLSGLDQELSVEGIKMEAQSNLVNGETLVTFSLPNSLTNTSLAIYDLEGKQVKFVPIDNQKHSTISINSAMIPAGMYFYSIIGEGKILGTNRLIVLER